MDEHPDDLGHLQKIAWFANVVPWAHHKLPGQSFFVVEALGTWWWRRSEWVFTREAKFATLYKTKDRAAADLRDLRRHLGEILR